MSLANWLKCPLLAGKCFGMFLRKNGSLDELGDQGFIAFLVVDWLCYRFVTERGLRLEKTMDLNSVVEPACKSDIENRELRRCHVKPIGKWYLDVLLRCINCFNTSTTNCVAF